MKKKTFTTLTLLMTATLLVACSGKKNDTKTSSTSASSTVQTKKSSSSSSQTSTSTSSTTTQSTTEEVTGMNLDAIVAGDYSSVSGTWQNANGATLVFDNTGLISKGLSISGTPTFDQGILQAGVVTPQSGFALLFIPKNVTIPQSHFHEGSDTSDISRDRLVGTQVALSEELVSSGAYYKVSDSTEVPDDSISLSNGQDTIDYATKILGDKAWNIIGDNYNRTNDTPYSLIQGNDNSLYYVYQNGVITDSENNLVYYPS